MPNTRMLCIRSELKCRPHENTAYVFLMWTIYKWKLFNKYTVNCNFKKMIWGEWGGDFIPPIGDVFFPHPPMLLSPLVMQSKKTRFFYKLFFLKPLSKKNFFFIFYYLQFKGRKVFFNTLECLFMLYTSCKTLHSVCQLHFHWFRVKLLNELQYKSI